jgi:hypothetical protein
MTSPASANIAADIAAQLSDTLANGWASRPEGAPSSDRAWIYHERDDLYVMLQYKTQTRRLRLVAYIPDGAGSRGPAPGAFSIPTQPEPDFDALAERITGELLPAAAAVQQKRSE